MKPDGYRLKRGRTTRSTAAVENGLGEKQSSPLWTVRFDDPMPDGQPVQPTEWKVTLFEPNMSFAESTASLSQQPSPQRSTKPRRLWTSAVTVAGLLLSAFCFWNGWKSPTRASAGAANVAAVHYRTVLHGGADHQAVLSTERRLKTAPIESLRPGQRVLAENPELTGVELAERKIDPLIDRLVSFRLEKPDGTFVEWDRIESLPGLLTAVVVERIALLTDAEIEAIPASALYQDNVDPPQDDVAPEELARRAERFLVGRTVEIDLAELGVCGPSQITAIAPCPTIEPDDGKGRRLITAVFRHQSSNVYEVQLDNGTPSIGVTGNHPFWSADRQEFVRADNLHPGERLQQLDNTTCRVTTLTKHRLTTPTTVYNIEVDGHHVYNVGAGGVLVHNVCPTYDQLRSMTRGTALQAHHLIEQRFKSLFGVKAGDMLALPLTRENHQRFTNAWRAAIPYGIGTKSATRETVEAAAKKIYAGFPNILSALGL